MSDLLPPCELIPYPLLALALAGFAALVFFWSNEEPQVPAYKWGDGQRRPPDPLKGAVSHFVGFSCCALALAYVLHHQLCG